MTMLSLELDDAMAGMRENVVAIQIVENMLNRIGETTV